MLESLDDSVGRVLAKLEQLGLTEHTVVVFTSDNGGLSTAEGPDTPATSNAALRHGRGYLHEGGIRVPLLVTWPGRVRAGAVERMPVSSIDLFPTVLAVTGVTVEHQVNGVSLDAVLRGHGARAGARAVLALPALLEPVALAWCPTRRRPRCGDAGRTLEADPALRDGLPRTA